MTPIRLFEYTDPDTGQRCCRTLAWFQALMPEATEEVVTAAHEGQDARWHSVNLKAATADTERQIKRAARVPDAQRGWVGDPDLLPRARALNAVSDWTFGAVSAEVYDALPLQTASVLDDCICMRLYGGNDAPFLAFAERARQQNASSPTSENTAAPPTA